MDDAEPFPSGTPIGPYTIRARIGSGGMGDVYRAHDPKLIRDVAIKVIRRGFTSDPERLARFQREARILASLNHPHIAAIYGLEDSGPTPALVMELVEGATLADRIRQGPLPIDEALRIARQITDALEYAHERGIVHRDLKPANVKVAADGTVKILDFGLAKALETGTPGADPADASTVSRLATEAGMVMGTAAYMSPEQATGKAVDRRTDAWAFGCVLYEMLTGTKAFGGETATDALAAVIRGEPDWALLPGATSWPVRALLRRCLNKDVRQRVQAIGDARIALEDVLARAVPDEPAAAGAPHPARRLLFEVVGAVILGGVAALVAWSLKPSPVVPQPVRAFTIALPPGQQLAGLNRGALAFSADGSQLAYVATAEDGRQQIHVRAMDTGVITSIAGSEGGAVPFFSPDRQWLGFFADGKLKKIPVKGGAAETLADVTSVSGASWSGRHTIVFAPLYSVIEEVSDAPGGTPHSLTHFEGSENIHAWPSVLPDSSAVVFDSYEASSGGIALQDAATGGHRLLIRGQSVGAPAYVASGYLTYHQGTNLMAVPFDRAHGQVTGDAVLIVPDVRQYVVSASGSLAYIAGHAPASTRRLVWVNRAGTVHVIDDRADGYYQPRLEPVPGDRIATDLWGQVWMFDRATHNLTPFTFGDRNQHAVWTRDGKQLVFMTQKGQTWQLSSQAADGSGKPERVAADAGMFDIPYAFTPDGRLAFVKYGGAAGSELWLLPLRGPAGGSAAAQRVFTIPAGDADAGPAFSPDGRWLAFAAADAAGHRQIFVQAYPGPGGKHQVSIDGGNEPAWNPDPMHQPLELFYRNGDDMMAVDITTRPAFVQDKPRRLFQGGSAFQVVQPNYVRANYDVSADGQRFLMLQEVQQKEAPIAEIHVVLNWAEELKRLVPAKH